jgi:hypothetical protein
MRLVYWGLAIGGFVLVVSWLWGALVAFSLILLLIIGYEIWRQSRPLALSNRPRKANPEDNEVEPQSKVPSPGAAVKPTAKPAAKFQVRLVGEKPVQQSGQSDLGQPTDAISSKSAVGGDRTVIQEPLTLISDANADVNAEAEAVQDFDQPDSDLANAPTVIESLDQIHFASAEANPNKADLAEELTVRPQQVSKQAEELTVQPQQVSKQAIAKPTRQPNPWDEPVTVPRPLNSHENQTAIRSPARTGEPTVARPFQSQSADGPTVASPFQPPSSADEKTVIGPLKAKAGNPPTAASPSLKSDLNNVTRPKPADGDSTPPVDNSKFSPTQSTEPEKPTVIGQGQSPDLEERTTL